MAAGQLGSCVCPLLELLLSEVACSPHLHTTPHVIVHRGDIRREIWRRTRRVWSYARHL